MMIADRSLDRLRCCRTVVACVVGCGRARRRAATRRQRPAAPPARGRPRWRAASPWTAPAPCCRSRGRWPKAFRPAHPAVKVAVQRVGHRRRLQEVLRRRSRHRRRLASDQRCREPAVRERQASSSSSCRSRSTACRWSSTSRNTFVECLTVARAEDACGSPPPRAR